jgi:hypothetical protein
MSNWGDAYTQQAGIVSTVKFTLEPSISPADSRNATADATNANQKNALKINVQRAVAKVALEIASAALASNAAGVSSSQGTFVPDTKWAAGNINMSEYPFQMWDGGSTVKSTRYDDVAPILPASGNQNWANKLDNSRWGGSAYAAQGLTVTGVQTAITASANNVTFGSANRVLVTENNNRSTYNHYSTFVVFAGQYKPNKYVVEVDNTGAVKDSMIFPAQWATAPAVVPQGGTTDTMYFVNSIDTFFLGKKALQEYIGWKILNIATTADPYTDAAVATWIANAKLTTSNQPANLQEYYRGYCFYRVWIRDSGATLSPNKILVRRNHIYNINITNILAPGIGNPNDIIDSHPENLEPIGDTDTYLTAQINILNWLLVQ